MKKRVDTERVVELRKQGQTLAEIGKAFGCSRENVRLHLRRAGVTPSGHRAELPKGVYPLTEWAKKSKFSRGLISDYAGKFGIRFWMVGNVKVMDADGFEKFKKHFMNPVFEKCKGCGRDLKQKYTTGRCPSGFCGKCFQVQENRNKDASFMEQRRLYARWYYQNKVKTDPKKYQKLLELNREYNRLVRSK